MDVPTRLKNAEELTNTNPTEGQKSSGNYKKGKIIIKGLKISIENPIGSERSGIDTKGKAWTNTMLFTYGYFNGTIGKDGDPIDTFLGPIVNEMEFDIYVIDQVDENTRAFDEHKVMFGFESADMAKKAYESSYNKGWKGFDKITAFSLSKFKKWIYNKDAIKYPASKQSMGARIDYKNAGDTTMKVVKMFGEVIEGETLSNLQKQAGDISKFEKLVVEIASPGGSVSEGLEIMVWLDSLSQQGKQIITVVTANAYSIASLIMLAADIKLISKHGKVMVHNPMVPLLEYVNANDLQNYIDSLRSLESIMYELYQVFTELPKERIKELMDNETYLTPEEAVLNGFADTVVDIKPKPYEMATNIKKEINMSKTLNILNRVIGMVNKSDFINQLYYDQTGGEIEIFQEDPSTYKIGDRTSVESGDVQLSDGSILKVEEYVITDINKTPEASPAVVESIIEPVVPVEPAAEFNEGPAPVIENAVDPIVPQGVPSGEPAKAKTDMPSKVIEKVESTVTTKETVALDSAQASEHEVIPEAIVPGEEAPKAAVIPEEMAPKAEAPIVEAPVAAIPNPVEEQMLALTNRITALEAKQLEAEGKFEAASKFEEIATKAIDTIATNTVSNFRPDASSPEAPHAKGSIFQQLKEKSGLR
jgi:ATP-dependent protease ClpP protease subunit